MSCKKCLMDLPSPLIIDILSRLPAKDIIRGSCVCKSWNNFLSDPEFINLHFSRSRPCFLVNNLSSSPPESSYFSLVEFDNEPDRRHDLRKVPGIRLHLPRISPDAEMNIVASVNGLVCSCEMNPFGHILYIWNPIMSEFIKLQVPESPKSPDRYIVSYGFGLSSKTGDYKVVRILQELGNADSMQKHECHVYTLGTGSWRSIRNGPIPSFCVGQAVFLEGNLHWLTQCGTDALYTFDLEQELLKTFPSPPLNEDYHKATLNLYNGCLCVCDNTEEFDVLVWVMTEYGVEKSWTKLLEITADPIGTLGNYFSSVCFVKVFSDGEILILLGSTLMFFHESDGVTWDVDGRELVRPDEARIGYHEEHYGPTFETVEYVSSFISLKKFGEEVVKIV